MPSVPADAGLEPIRKDLLDLKPFRLRGAVCDACGTRSFPVRDFCPNCLSDRLHVEALAPHGTVFSFTTVHIAPAGRETPYTLAYVDLDDEVRVFAQISEGGDRIAIGDRVELVAVPVRVADGDVRIGYAFQPSRKLAREAVA